MSLQQFLKTTKKTFADFLVSHKPISIVVGNQSGDLDSVVSAIGYAYLSNLAGKPLVPVLNFASTELRLRNDVVYLLQKLQIDANDLCFASSLSKIPQNQIRAHIVLVDHNKLEPSIANTIYCSNEGEDNVVGIIDHHVDEKEHLEADPRIIEPAGSCSSLVSNYWFKKLDIGKFSQDAGFKQVVMLLTAALLIDTSNVYYQLQQVDRNMHGIYCKVLGPINLTSFFLTLKHKKEEISHLSVQEIIKKDYKSYSVGSTNIVIGIGSVTQSFDWLTKTFLLDTVINEMKNFCVNNNVQILMLMTKFRDKNGFHRELAIFNREEETSNSALLSDYLQRSDLQLKVKYRSSSIIVFDQLSVGSSRKQVAPLVKKAFD